MATVGSEYTIPVPNTPFWRARTTPGKRAPFRIHGEVWDCSILLRRTRSDDGATIVVVRTLNRIDLHD